MATSFDMGLLGDLFGGGGETGLEGYLTPAQQQAMQRQGLLQAAMAIGQASGPSTTPRSLMQILSSGVAAGQQGYAEAQKNAITNLLTKQKMDEYKMAQEQRRRLEEIFGVSAPVAGMPMTSEQALAAPGGQVGPTVERAAMVGQVPEAAAVSPEDMRYDQYMKAAQLYAASDPAKSKAYMDQALLIKPREEVTGQPFEVTGSDGKPVMVQQFKGGKIKTLEGFGPKREVVLQNVDGRVVAIDKNALKGGESYGTGITPAEQQRLNMDAERLKMERQRLGMEARRLNISEQEFQRGQYERMENEEGVFYVPKVPGLPAIPVSGPGGVPLKGKAPPKPTEGEANAAGFANQMENAEAVIKALPAGSQPGVGSAMAGSVPLLGGVFERGVQSAPTQQYKQAADAWIRAKLRKESGAAIGVDEMAKEYQTYFPQIGDSAAVIAQKARSRQIATDAMKKSAGKSYSSTTTGGGGLTWNPATQQFE
jgi:hypothetical protein